MKQTASVHNEDSTRCVQDIAQAVSDFVKMSKSVQATASVQCFDWTRIDPLSEYKIGVDIAAM